MASGTRITSTGVLYINGQQVENTFNNVSRITRRLENELRRLPVGTREFVERAQEVRQARARFEEVQREIAAVNGTLERTPGVLAFFQNGLIQVGDTFREVFTANLVERFLDGVIAKGKQTVDQLLEIADAMTDVQKTSGMSLNQVKELWDAFDEMDTRTNKMDRLKIAEVGGRLGVPIEEMKSFVQEVDKAYVALGDSFEGGLEGVVDQLGKIKGLFDGTKEMSYAEAINRVGSALNTLAAQGTASEGNIAQFALRIGTLPDALKPAIDKVLGLGAAFEESGIDSQIASSGLSNFLTTAGENIEGFAYSMHMTTKEAQDLLNTKPEEFFLRFAQGMKGLSATDTSKVLESLKLNSLEVQKAIGAAANRTDEFRKAMKTAGVEMDNMNSLTDEFNQKNNNAPAILEKIKNAFNDIFTTTNVINKFEWLIQLIGWITGVTSSASDGIREFKDRLEFLIKIITVVTVGTLSYAAAVKLLNSFKKEGLIQTAIEVAFQKSLNAIYAIQRGAVLLLAAAKALLTGNITRASAAMRAFNMVTKLNPIGLLIGIITAAVTAFILFRKEAENNVRVLGKVATAARVAGDIQKNIAKEEAAAMGDMKKKTELYLAIIKDKNTSLATRKKAYENLIAIYPEFKGTLDDEYRATDKLTSVYDKLIAKLKQVSTVRAYQKLLDQAADAKVKAEQEKIDAEFAKKQEELNNKKAQEDNKKRAEQSEKERQMMNTGDKFDRQSIAMREAMDYKETSDKSAKAFDNADKKLKNAESRYDEILRRISSKKELADQILGQNDENTPDPGKNTAAPDNKKNREAETAKNDLEKSKDAYTKALEAKTEADKKMLELQRAYEDEKNKILEEARQKAIDDENIAFERRKQDLQQENVVVNNLIKKSQDEIAKLQRDKAETKSPEAAKNFEAAISKLQETNKKRQNLISINNEIVEQLEQTHQYNLLKIKEHWDGVDFEKFVKKEQLEIDEIRRKDEEEIIAITKLSDAKAKIKAQTDLKLTNEEFRSIKTLEEAKAALREAADRKMLNAQLISLNKQKALLVGFISQLADGPAKEKLLEDLAKIEQAVTAVKAAINNNQNEDNKSVEEDQQKAKENTDILGFSAKDWEDTFSNIDNLQDALKATAMVFQALGNAGQMYAQLQQALGERELRHFNSVQDKKKKSLLKQLNDGYITREEYTKQTEKLEAEAAAKKAEIEYKQAKADKMAKIFSAIGATALGVANALSTGPAGIALAAIVGALGAIQIGIIAAQPLPEKPKFADGGFTGDGFGSPDNTGFRPAGVVHENEWVAPKWMLEEPRTAKVIDYLESVRSGKTKPMAEGGFSDNTTSPVASNSIRPGSAEMIEYLAILTQVKYFLEKLYDEGVEAFIGEDAKNAKKMKKMMNDLEQLENKNKH